MARPRKSVFRDTGELENHPERRNRMVSTEKNPCLPFVSRSEIRVPQAEVAALERAFEDRARRVDLHPGFLGLELLRDIRENGRYVLLTWWQSRGHFTAYMRSGDHERAHAREHPGLSPVKGRGALEQFHVVVDVRTDEPSEP